MTEVGATQGDAELLGHPLGRGVEIREIEGLGGRATSDVDIPEDPAADSNRDVGVDLMDTFIP